MALNLDPEFVHYVQGIYGNADLDGKVIKQLYQTWKSNPQFIINAYNQKNQVQQNKPQLASMANNNIRQISKPEVAQDDLSGITNFGDAFKIASQRNLSQFKWRGTKANPSGLFAVTFATKKQSTSKPAKPAKPSSTSNNSNQSSPSSTQTWSSLLEKAPTFNLIELVKGKPFWDGTFFPVDKSLVKKAPSPVTNSSSTLKQDVPSSPLPRNREAESQARQSAFERMTYQNWRSNRPSENSYFRAGYNFITPSFYQQGGTMQQQSSQEQELQKAFLAYLIQDAAQQGIQLQSEQDLQAYAQQLGEEGIKAKYQEFIQKMQGGTMAKLGAKLEYLKKLKGVNETDYYKQGGSFCKTHQQHHMETAQKGKKLNAVQQFKKDMKTKDEASRDSIAINKWQDQDTMAKKGNKGNFKKGTWVPDRKKYKK